MKTYTSTYPRASLSPTVVALGCFDGVHIGHTRVIALAKKIADERSLPLTVWSFEEPPKNYFLPDSVPLLTDTSEKRALMRKLAVDRFFCVQFDEKIASMPAEKFFFDILLKKIGAVHIVCGFNFNFGAKGAGNTALLEKLCAENGIGLSVLEPVTLDGVSVSSSAIRKAIADGDMTLAKSLLGRPYALREKVVNGQHLARRFGFSTANQIFPDKKAVLRYGVYRVRVKVGKKTFDGISNVGIRPTVNASLLCAETHIFGFEGDLYGKYITVEFLEFIRPEQKFDSIAKLEKQIKKDIEYVRKLS